MQRGRLCYIDVMWADCFKEESLEKAGKSVFTLDPIVPFLNVIAPVCHAGKPKLEFGSIFAFVST